MFTRTRITAALAAAVATGGLAVGIAQATSPGLTAPKTIALEMRGGTSSSLNLAHKKYFASGDVITLDQPAYLGTGKTKIGRGVVNLELVGNAFIQVHASVMLHAGEIELSGVEPNNANTFTLAVIGGTGAYQNARGEAVVHAVSPNANPVTATVTMNLIP
jgi:hypothetical protein